jgi:hypothetical protein
MIASALMVNVRRLQKNQANPPATPVFLLLASLLTLWNCQQRGSPPVHPLFVPLACPEPDDSRLPFGQFNSFSLSSAL